MRTITGHLRVLHATQEHDEDRSIPFTSCQDVLITKWKLNLRCGNCKDFLLSQSCTRSEEAWEDDDECQGQSYLCSLGMAQAIEKSYRDDERGSGQDDCYCLREDLYSVLSIEVAAIVFASFSQVFPGKNFLF